MSNYDQTLTLTVPIALLEIAKQLGRAFDPDVGGYESFGYRLDANMQACAVSGLVEAYAQCVTPCTTEFAQQAVYMLANPEALYAAVLADYAARWPALVPPTLAECQAFCAGLLPDPVAV